ncbi:MAG: MFS transporter [Alphaproteobacteria bacterium]|jgi:GPH family glycoside/pentoside/hexuronide:cation symporter|nr:MFS transporter [Alphaproteobacteria bacterium]
MEQKITADRSKPFGWSDKIGYAFGDMGNNFTFNLVSSFLMIYLTNILGIEPYVIAILFLLARVIDAFADLTVGRLLDISKLRGGNRFKPWIDIYKWPLVIMAVMLFLPYVNTWSMGARIIYVAIVYLGWGIIYSFVNIPYGSLSAAISDDAFEKTSLSTWRTLGATFGSMIVNCIPLIVFMNIDGIKKLNGDRFFFVVLAMGILAIITYRLSTKLTTERITVDRAKPLPLKKLFKDMSGNRALLALLVLDLILVLNQNLNGANMTYLFTYYFGNITALAITLQLQFLLVFLVAPFASWLTRRFGRKEATTFALLCSFVIFGTLFILQTNDIIVFIALNILGNVGLVVFNIMVWAFINDVIDNHQVLTGVREVGSIYAVNSFARKSAQAIAGSFGATIFAIIGFVPSTNGGAEQSDSVIRGIYLLATGIPTFCAIAAAIVLAFWYPLNKKRMNENIEILRRSM